MSPDSTVTHVRLLVDEYAETFRFYRDVVGLGPTFGDAGSGYADLDTGDVTLALFDAAEMAAAVDGEPASAGTGDGDEGRVDAAAAGEQRGRERDEAVVVLRVDDVEDAASDLESDGVDLAAPPADHPEWGIRTVHCRDPDGNLLEFNEPLEPYSSR